MSSARVLVVVSTAETGKAALALAWAAAARENGWVGHVEAALFGPVQEALARGDEAIARALERARKAGVEVVACQRYADSTGTREAMERLGLPLEIVGKRIAERAGEGYTILVF